jgi:hypothetical protein
MFGAVELAAAQTHRLRFVHTDPSGTPTAARLHLADAEGKAIKAPQLPFFADHLVFDGKVELELAAGNYTYSLERGPEYETATGTINLDRDSDVVHSLARIASLREQGWYAADLHVHRPLEEIELLMRAEDLDFVPVITWWNDRNPWFNRRIPNSTQQQFDGNRWYDTMAGEDEREGGALLYFGLSSPLDIAKTSREYPSPMTFVEQAIAANPHVWIDIEKPFWWDVPVWLASGKMRSIGLANNHQWRSGVLPNEAWGKARDESRLPAPPGNAQWSQEIYHHALNAGFRIPPSAGSASGVLPNPVGYNRVYVQLEQFTPEAWWQGLHEGRCFVTNGPLLQCRLDDHTLPGSVLSIDAPRNVKISVVLTSRDPIRAVEVIYNGAVIKNLPLTDATTQTIDTELSIASSGWLLVRAIADIDHTFRFASTGPCYIEHKDGREHISRASVRFFQDWLNERVKRVEANVTNPLQREAVLKYHREARVFWNARLQMATAE